MRKWRRVARVLINPSQELNHTLHRSDPNKRLACAPRQTEKTKLPGAFGKTRRAHRGITRSKSHQIGVLDLLILANRDR